MRSLSINRFIKKENYIYNGVLHMKNCKSSIYKKFRIKKLDSEKANRDILLSLSDWKFTEKGEPICITCGKTMVQAIDTKDSKKSGYSWMCACCPDLRLSMG